MLEGNVLMAPWLLFHSFVAGKPFVLRRCEFLPELVHTNFLFKTLRNFWSTRCCWQTFLERMEITEVLLAEVLNVCWSYQSGLHSSYISEQLCKPHCSDRHMPSKCGPHVAKYFQQPLVQLRPSLGLWASVVAGTCSVWSLMPTLLRTLTNLTTCIKP